MSRKPMVVSADEIIVEHAGAGPVDARRIALAVSELLAAIGEDGSRAGLVDTPRRVAESFADLFSGYAEDPVRILEPLPDERGEGLIMVRAIPMTSICEHHLLPFTGTATVAYLPSGPITGLSKLARVTEVLARRLQVQERLVREIADALEHALKPRGVFVMVEAEQLCMTIRGARRPGSITVTTEARGAYADDPAARAELIALARGSS